MSVVFIGTKADSSTVTESFTTDSILSTLETFNFSGNFTNLVSVSWTQNYPFHQFDNINVTSSAVPEPLTILGAATAISFGTAFKRKLAKNSKKK